MKRIFQIIKSNKVLAKNFTSLSLLQISNYLFPLITLPYLVRVLGPAKYGLINFAAAFIAYFSLICDYGFSLSGTKIIAQIRNDKEKLSLRFSAILSIKLILLIISFLIFILTVLVIPFFNNNWELYLFSFGFVVGNVFFPNWFFMGIEQMKYITILNLLIRSISTVLIFIFIQVESDFLLLVLFNSSAQILIGLFGFFIALFKFQIKFKLPNLKELKSELKEGWNIFLSMISNNIYTSSNTFILGLFASETVVGYFAAADKIRMAFQGIQSVLAQSVFPFVNNLFRESYQNFILFIKKFLKLQPIVGLLISLLLFVFPFQITDFLLGQQYTTSAVLLRIIAGIPFIVSISNIFGIQIMLTLGYDKAYNLILGFSAVIHIMFLLVLVPQYFAVGTSISILFTEFIVMLLTFLFVNKNKIIHL